MQDNEKLRATPKRHNPAVRHAIGGTVDGTFTPNSANAILLPKADVVEIEAEPDAYFMFRYSSNGEPLGDTWHASLEDALALAEIEFGIQKQDWETLPNP